MSSLIVSFFLIQLIFAFIYKKKHHHFLFFKDQCLIISLHRIPNSNNYEPQRHGIRHLIYNALTGRVQELGQLNFK